MAQKFTDKEIKRVKSSIQDGLDSLEDLEQEEVIRVNDERTGLIVQAKQAIRNIETNIVSIHRIILDEER